MTDRIYRILGVGTPFARVEVARELTRFAHGPDREPPTFFQRVVARLHLLETAVWIWWDLLKRKFS